MKTSDQHSSLHSYTFDTRLLEQVIELSVDAAVRQLSHQRGIAIESVNQSEWVRTIVHHISAEMARRVGHHELLPVEIDEEITAEIDQLINQETHKHEVPECASMVRPVHGLLHLPHHAGMLWRRFFEK